MELIIKIIIDVIIILIQTEKVIAGYAIKVTHIIVKVNGLFTSTRS